MTVVIALAESRYDCLAISITGDARRNTWNSSWVEGSSVAIIGFDPARRVRDAIETQLRFASCPRISRSHACCSFRHGSHSYELATEGRSGCGGALAEQPTKPQGTVRFGTGAYREARSGKVQQRNERSDGTSYDWSHRRARQAPAAGSQCLASAGRASASCPSSFRLWRHGGRRTARAGPRYKRYQSPASACVGQRRREGRIIGRARRRLRNCLRRWHAQPRRR